MASVFSKIINNQISCYKVAEDNYGIAFLDISPLKKGHVLVVAKQEVDNLFELEAANYVMLMLMVKNVGIALKTVVPCAKIGMAVVGLEVAHAHVHLIPINTAADMNFGNKKLQMLPEEMTKLAAEIAAAYTNVIA